MDGKQADQEHTDPQLPEDASWLVQYYTAEKQVSLPATTHVESAPPDMPDKTAGLGLTTLPSAKYAMAEPIGSGGMKIVRRAQDKDTTRTVAVATIRGELETPDMAARFIREARITALLEHPNIVPVHDLGTDAAGRPYFTMKLLEGENLHDILKKLDARDERYVRQYNLHSLLAIFQKVCDAIAFAHSRGIVHRDLKPANIHVSRFGEVLVLDWGLAAYAGEADAALHPGDPAARFGDFPVDLTLPGSVRGTPGFMAPEQARGDSSRKDKRTDIYALGAILYAMLTLKAPPTADTAPLILSDTIAGNILSPRLRAPERDIPAALESVAMKALAVKPADRYVSAEALSADVDAFLGGYATSAQKADPLTLLWLLIKRHPTRVTVSALVLLLIAGIAAVSMAQIRASERAEVEALNKYKAEQEENRKLGIDAAPQVLKRAEKYMRELRIDDAMRELDLACVLDSSLTAAWMDKGLLELARQDFAGARESFRHLPAPQKPMPAAGGGKKEAVPPKGPLKDTPKRKIEELGFAAEKYHLMTDGGMRPLRAAEFYGFASNVVQLSSRAAPGIRTAAAFTVFSHWNQAHGTAAETRAFGMNFIKLLNPKAENILLEVTEMDGGLKVVLHAERDLSNIASLAGLRLVWLDIAGTEVSDLGVLHGAPLTYLDVSGTAIREIAPVADAPLKELRMKDCKGLEAGFVVKLPQLERLVLSKGALEAKDEIRARERAGLDVIFK